ncbi:MAG TPA: TRAFs-binding domain-containing protein [Thermoanaerobaculia bacterium]|nr:TRAFs-binding domain-containing protein [Thermoanaerobaculia bacterium]
MPPSHRAARPLCFVLMPFGKKADPAGREIDFDDVYGRLIGPAIEDAGLQPVRADEEVVGGIIHKPMFERLLLCDYAVADLTLANANVFYELGVRHAVRPFTTVLVFAAGQRLPFDLAPMRGLPYDLGADGKVAQPKRDRKALAGLLRAARQANIDSPVFQLVEGFRAPDLAHLKTDTFRERVEYSQRIKDRLAAARAEGAEQVAAIERELGELADEEAGVLIDLMLSYRAVKAWRQMIELIERLPVPLRRVVMVREQYAFALNRASRGADAERELKQVLAEHGPSSETYGLLGRVYKDRWEVAKKEGKDALAKGLLEQAADAYRKGFEADWRDYYPGINAVTLMELMEPPDPRREELAPIVVYSAKRRVTDREGDYWDWATLLEARVLARDESGAREALGKALARVREKWEPETTARNLRLIREAREARGEPLGWLGELEAVLLDAVIDKS